MVSRTTQVPVLPACRKPYSCDSESELLHGRIDTWTGPLLPGGRSNHVPRRKAAARRVPQTCASGRNTAQSLFGAGARGRARFDRHCGRARATAVALRRCGGGLTPWVRQYADQCWGGTRDLNKRASGQRVRSQTSRWPEAYLANPDPYSAGFVCQQHRWNTSPSCSRIRDDRGEW